MPKLKWELNYAGVELPPPDSDGMSLVLQPIDDFERNANGDAFIQPINMKRTIPCTWRKLTGEKVYEIMSTLVTNRTGLLRYFDISENAVAEREVYWGAGPKVDYTLYDDDLKASVYSALTINFVML